MIFFWFFCIYSLIHLNYLSTFDFIISFQIYDVLFLQSYLFENFLYFFHDRFVVFILGFHITNMFFSHFLISFFDILKLICDFLLKLPIFKFIDCIFQNVRHIIHLPLFSRLSFQFVDSGSMFLKLNNLHSQVLITSHKITQPFIHQSLQSEYIISILVILLTVKLQFLIGFSLSMIEFCRLRARFLKFSFPTFQIFFYSRYKRGWSVYVSVYLI